MTMIENRSDQSNDNGRDRVFRTGHIPLVSCVIPAYNEGSAIEQNLPVILEALDSIDNVNLQVLVVDDGSTDDTSKKVRFFCEQRPDLELICLNRNFGKEAAVHAGLLSARGDAVVCMDSDLQHPPTLISQMVDLWKEGYDVVEGCKSCRSKETLISKCLAQGFYALFNFLTGLDIQNKSDFQLLDRKVVDAYCEMPERKRFFRGMIPWMGFSSAQLFFDVPERQNGVSSWSRLKLLRFSLTALSGFTSAPLHIVTLSGFLFFVICLVMGTIALYQKYIIGNAVSGFTTVILLVLITGSLIMFALGQIGIYIEQIFDEIKQRPTFLINEQESYIKKRKIPEKY